MVSDCVPSGCCEALPASFAVPQKEKSTSPDCPLMLSPLTRPAAIALVQSNCISAFRRSNLDCQCPQFASSYLRPLRPTAGVYPCPRLSLTGQRRPVAARSELAQTLRIAPFAVALCFWPRHLAEQYFTSSQTFSHFLRQKNGL